MDEITLSCLVRQVESQCKFLILSCRYVEQAMSSQGEEKTTHIFFHLQSLLSAYANISKVFWPARGKEENRYVIRQRLGVYDQMFKNRKVRDSFDHADERIITHLAERSPNQIADNLILPKSRFRIMLMPDGSEGMPLITIRQFDPETGILYFWDEAFDTKLAFAEACQLLSRIESLTKAA